MRIRRIIAACTFAVIAVMFALPAGAYASGSAIMLSQSDFDSADNHCYMITKPGIYRLAQDVQGTFNIPSSFDRSSDNKIIIDLNGHKLADDADTGTNSAIVVEQNAQVNLTVKSSVAGGTITCSAGKGALRMCDEDSTLVAKNLTATSINFPCLDVESGHFYAKSGSYSTTNTDDNDAEVLWVNEDGWATIEDGTFALSGNGSTVVKHNAQSFSRIALDGGSFSHVPSMARLNSNKIAYRADDGTYRIAAAKEAALAFSDESSVPYAVTNVGRLGVVLFANQELASAVQASLGGTLCEAANHTVTFYSDASKEDVYQTQTVPFYDVAVRPAAPGTSSAKGFANWTTQEGAYNFDTPVTQDIELIPTWSSSAPLAKLSANTTGKEASSVQYFATLQEALDTASAMSTAATVTLLADVSGSVAVTDASHLTLDLGTYTLSWSGEWDQQNEDAICATGCANLTVTNGHINVSNYRNTGIRLDSCHDFLIKNVDVTCYDDDGDDRRCMVIDHASSGIIDGGTYVSNDGDDGYYSERIPALYVGSDSVLTIKDGKFSANDYSIVEANESTIIIEGGSFESGTNPLDLRFSDVTIKGGSFLSTGVDKAAASASFSKVMINGGSFAAGGQSVLAFADSDTTVGGGSFDKLVDLPSVANGKAVLKHADEQGRYEVLAESKAQDAASWVVNVPAVDGESAYKVYFESEEEARAFAEINEGSTVEQVEHGGSDGGSSDYVVYAKSVDVELSAITAGSELPSTAKAVLVRADASAVIEVAAQLAWSTLDGAEVEAGSKALGNTSYVVQASVAPSKNPEVWFSSAITATFNGADALGVSVAKDGSLEASYGFTTDAVSISGASIAIPKASYAYTGKRVRPVPFVTLGEEQLSAGIDYTVSYSANKRVGTAMVTVTGTGQYAGTVSKGFKIVPAKVKGVAAKAAGKGKVKVSWAKHKAQTTGFEVRYGTSKAKVKAGKGVKTAKAKGAKVVSKKLKGLKAGKRFYVQVRAYKIVDGKTYCSAWSKVRSAKVK